MYFKMCQLGKKQPRQGTDSICSPTIEFAIQHRSAGKSLDPLVYSSDVCFLWPIQTAAPAIQPGDIVFAEVQPDVIQTEVVWKCLEQEKCIM